MTLETTSYTDDAGVTHWTGEVADEFACVCGAVRTLLSATDTASVDGIYHRGDGPCFVITSDMEPVKDETGGFNAYEVDGQKYIAHDGIQYVPVSDAYTLHLLAGKIDALTAQQENIAVMLATVVEQVGPTLDKLTDHPMLKMFLGGK